MGVAGVNIKGGLLAACAASAVFAWASGASAQVFDPAGLSGAGLSGPGMSSTPTSGPLAKKHLDLNAAVTATYDSNVAEGNSAVAAARQVTPGEYLISPHLNIDATLPIGFASLFAAGTVGYDYHQSNTKLQSERINLSGGVQSGLGVCGGGLNGAIARGQSELSDLSLAVTRNIQQSLSTSLSVQCSGPAGFGLTGSGSYSQTSNTAGDTVALDSSQHSFSGGVTYRNSLLGTLELTGSYSHSDYDNTGPSGGTRPGYSSYGANFTLHRPIGERLTGSASIGVGWVRPGATPLPAGAPGTAGQGDLRFTGLSGSGLLTYFLNERSSLSLNYSRSAIPSLIPGADYNLSQQIALNGNYRFSSRLSGNFGAGFNSSDYRVQGAATPLTTGVTRQHGWSVNGGLSFRIGERSSLSLTSSYSVRNAMPTMFDYSSYRVGLTASTSF